MYIPDGTESWGGAAYLRPNHDGTAYNHKLLRIWGNWPEEGTGHDGYDSGGKNVGFSTHPWDLGPLPRETENARAKLSGDLMNGVEYNGSNEIIGVDDVGTWIEIQLGTRSCTSETDTSGFARVWKNGVKVYDFSNFNNWVDNDRPDANIRNNGYLYGAANSAFHEDTIWFIDDVYFATEFIV